MVYGVRTTKLNKETLTKDKELLKFNSHKRVIFVTKNQFILVLIKTEV